MSFVAFLRQTLPIATVFSALADPHSLRAWPQLGPDSIAPLQISVADMAYSPWTSLVYVCVPANGGTLSNTLTAIDPLTGNVLQSVPVHGGPSKVVASDDGQYLYVATSGGNRIEQINAASGVIEHSFTMGSSGSGPYTGPYSVTDIDVLPGQATSIAVACIDAYFASEVRIYDNGALRSQKATGTGITALDFSTNSSVLYGYQMGSTPAYFNTLSVTASGVTVVSGMPNTLFGRYDDFVFADGKIYSTSAGIYEPLTAKMRFPFNATGEAMAVDAPAHRIAYVPHKSSYFEKYRVQIFSLDTCLPLGQIQLTSPPGYPTTKLIRWGADGLALIANTNQIYFLRTWMLPSAPPADLRVTETFTPAGTTNAVLKCAIENTGPNAAQQVKLTVSFEGTVAIGPIHSSTGTFQVTNSQVLWDLGVQDMNSTNSVWIQFSQPLTNTVVATARVTSSNVEENRGDNTAMRVISTPTLAPAGHAYSFTLPIVDMVRDLLNGGIFLAVDRQMPDWGNGIVHFTPLTGQFSSSIWVGTNIQHLALSKDGQTLYAGSMAHLTRLNPATLAIVTNYPSTDLEVPYAMAVFPDDPTRVAIIQQDQKLRVYQGGMFIAETNVFFNWLVPADSGPVVRALTSRLVFEPTSFRVTNGVMSTESSVSEGWLQMPGDACCENDRIFSGNGRVYDLPTHQLLGTFNVPGSDGTTLVGPDLVNGRVFFARNVWSEGVKLHAFDATRFRLLGSLLVPAASNPGTFILWGDDGFAFVAGKVFIVRSSLRPNGPEAELALKLSGGSNPGALGQLETYTVILTNAGPETATGIVTSVTSALGGTFASINASQGSTTVSNLQLSWSVGALASGLTASMNFNFTPGAAGFQSVIALVSAPCLDRYASNDVSAHIEIVTNEVWPGAAVLSGVFKSVVSDPGGTKLFVSLDDRGGPIGNSIIEMDPQTGEVSEPVYVGSNPNQLAVSKEGSTLYVGLDGASTVQEVSTTSLQPLGWFSVSNGFAPGIMEALPGSSDRLLLYRNPLGVALYENGIELSNRVSVINTFAYDDASGFVFGCDRNWSGVPLCKLTVSADGLSAEELSDTLQQQGSDLKTANGLLFYDHGLVISTTTETQANYYPADKSWSRVQPALDRGLVYFLGGEYWMRMQLRAFRSDSGEPAGTVALPGVLGEAGPLARWGATGLAFTTASSQLCLLRDQFTSDGPVADVAVLSLSAPRAALTNTPATYTCTITNHSDATAPSTMVTAKFGFVGSVLQVQASTGAAQLNGTTILWNLGDFPSHAVAQMQVQLLPAVFQTITNSTAVLSSVFDPAPANNSAQAFTAVWGFSTNAQLTALSISNATDLVYDSRSGLLWASMTDVPVGGMIVPIDPVEGVVGPGISVNSEVTRLGLSCDSAYLYCLLPKAAGVARVNLSSRQVDQFTSVGYNGTGWGFHTPYDLAASPTNPTQLAVSYSSMQYGENNFVGLIADGILQPQIGVSPAPDNAIEFSAQGDRLFGLSSDGYYASFSLATNGITLVTNWNGIGMGTDVERAGSLLYGTSGQVLEPASITFVTNISGMTATAVEAASAENRLYYATKSPFAIRVYNLTNYALLGTNPLSGVTSDLLNLVRWGINGLAMRTHNGQVLLLRSPLVPVPPGHDMDGDGMSDAWESLYGLNPYDNTDAALDLDRNGLVTLEEYWAGIDPYSGSNPLKFKRVSFAGSTLTLAFKSLRNRSHSIEFVPTLDATNWTGLTNGIIGTGNDLTNQILVAPNQPAGFLRLRAEP